MSESEAPVWVLLGERTGDNNQLLRLAGELGLPFRPIELRYNALRLIGPRRLGATLASLESKSRAQIKPPWPRLVLGIGNRSVPAALAIRRLSEGKAKLVRLGNPRLNPARFDLVITTPQYPVPDAPTVIRLPFGLSTAPALEATPAEAEWLDALPRPHRLFLVGGDTFMWTVTPDIVAQAASALRAKPGGSVIAVTSARSGPELCDSVRSALDAHPHGLLAEGFPRYPVLLHDADEIAVTADSVAMVSDSIAAQKPVGLVEPRQTAAGRFFYGLERLGFDVPVRDIRRFWQSVRSRHLAGTVANPVVARLRSDPLATAVTAIREVLSA